MAPRLDDLGDPLPDDALRRLGTIRYRHGDGICALVYAPRRQNAGVAWDGIATVRLWEAETGRQLRQFHEPDTDPLTQLAFSPDGKLLAAAGGDPCKGGNTAIRFWDVANGHEIQPLRWPQAAGVWRWIRSVPDGPAVAVDRLRSGDSPGGGDRQTDPWTITAAGSTWASTAAMNVAPNRTQDAGLGRRRNRWINPFTSGTRNGVEQFQRLTGPTAAACCRWRFRRTATNGLASANPFEPVRLWNL